MKNSTIILSIIVVMACASPVLGSANAQTPRNASSRKALRTRVYACPMHGDVTSSRPRKCPKCGMTLRPIKVAANTSNLTEATAPPLSAIGESNSFSSKVIPDVEVVDQDGRRLKFSTDLIKGKTVAINFIFTTCTTICPPLTATFRRVQQDLNTQNVPAQLISISVDPTTDTPERLRAFAAKFKAGPGWTFVTGDKASIDYILQSLGAAVADKNDHTPTVLIGNDVSRKWTRAYGLSAPTSLVKTIRDVAGQK